MLLKELSEAIGVSGMEDDVRGVILNAIQDDEKDVQEEQQRFKGRGNYRGNDW